MYNIKINKKNFLVKSQISIIEACRYVGIFLPRFCYHEILSVAGNCRMCLVEIEKAPKPVVGCATPITNNISLFTDSPLVKKARENVLELLLLNHPLDCPICDQAGECDLQEQTKKFGGDLSRFLKKKRVVEDKNFGVTVKTIMTRCIHCTRCVRFSDEISGTYVFGTLNRGNSTEIGSYKTSVFNSEISGNIIDLCPVGALTSKQYSFKARPWEIKTQETVDCTDGFGSNIIVSTKETEIIRIQPKLNNNIITDKTRYVFDSLNKNRIKKIFIKTNKYESIDVNLFKKEIYNIVTNNKNNLKKIVVLINDNIDSELLLLLNTLKNQIEIRTDSFNNKENFYLNQILFNKTNILSSSKNKTKMCFLFSINLNTECVLLNVKLRIKQNQKNISIISSGYNFNISYNIKFVNLTLILLLKFFEGRRLISKQFKPRVNSLFIFGQSLKNRISSLYPLLVLIKKYFSKSIVYNVNLNCNTESLAFFGNRRINTKVLKRASNIFALQLEDNIFMRKLLKKNLSNLLWFNTHGSFLALKSKYVVPYSTYFETEKYYLNMNFYLQKTQAIFKENNLEIENLFSFFIFTIQKNFKFSEKKNLFFTFQYEYNKLKTVLFKNIKMRNKVSSTIMFYPIKSVIEDFYLTNVLCKNSLFLTQKAQENYKNFKKYL